MRPTLAICCCLAISAPLTFASPKQHVVSFGKWATIKWLVGEDESQAINVKVRPLLVDGRIKEFTIGVPHDLTERTFVLQRMYRLNDSLDQESGPTRWRWERGAWLLVDRVSGKIQALALPSFDPYLSTVTWFRDYAAYCGASEDGKKIFAVVAEVGRRKPLLKKPLADMGDADMPDSTCPAATWQRGPSRVTFNPKNDQKFTYAVRSRAIDVLPVDVESGEE